ncbi:hypothetical protein DD237_003891 [Peronospora effusa]|uniref:Fungal lipase-type domain-containing protein n=1 Tax=Peronospora effusa TaxID=542832 RepID=A0A425CH36_9STRA|nr:hypothetical protein DD237_003891 [Peronospora effusa]
MMLRRRLLRSSRVLGRRTTSSSSTFSLDKIKNKWMQATVKELSVEMLPALKVMSESLRLLRQSPTLRNSSASDWLVGLSVLTQYKSQHHVTGLYDETHKKALVLDQELMAKLLRYVRVCDAVYASSVTLFCKEAAVSSDCVLRAHSGGVVSPKCVILADHEHKELVLVARGTASLLDFCTDLCLHNEPFENGQGHRGMVHAATWLVHHLHSDLKELSEKYPDYRLVATGHSLGAAVAALATIQLRKEFPTIQCYAFGTPACVTQELATGTYDFVTTVVNGYDCVPRLHQHSLMQLQDEIRCFDWRTALKKMVMEEIHKQKVALEKQPRAKLEELHVTLRKMNFLQFKERTNKATAKLDQVKRVASDNVMELAHDVDKLLADKLDAIFSIFKANNLSLEHVAFIKNLVKCDDLKKGDSFWWKRVNEGIVGLERLSSAVTKPKELERVLIELRKVLQKTSASSRNLQKSDGDHDVATGSPRLKLLRSQVDDMIDKSRTRISGQVSKVSTAVTSNVKAYVDTIKEETESLGTIAQEELDQAVDTIYRNLPFFGGPNSEKTNDDQSSTQKKKNRGDKVLEEADPSQRMEDESGKGTEQEHEELKKIQLQWEKDNKLHHDPLFPPGRIIYLNRVITPGSSPQSVTAGSSIKTDVEVVEVATDDFSRVVLSNRMLLDHLCTDYEKVLQCQAELLKSPPDST